MGELTLRATGPVRASVAWERYADTRQWSSWSPQVRAVELDPVAGGTGDRDHRLRTGLTGRVVGPFGLRVPFVVDDVDEQTMTWAWHVTVGPLRVDLLHRVLDHVGGTVTELVIHAPAPVAFAYSAPAQLALHRLVRS